MIIQASLAVYYNKAGSGYQILGESPLPLERYSGEGWFLRSVNDGWTCAVLCRKRMVGKREAQFNIALTYRGSIPFRCIKKLKKFMEDLKEPSSLQITVDLGGSYSPKHPKADPDLMACILRALHSDPEREEICVVPKGEFTEIEILNTLSRLPVINGVSLALPLPEGAPVCQINLQSSPGRLANRLAGGKRAVIAQRKSQRNRWTEYAEAICCAPTAIISMAVESCSLDPYMTYYRVRCGRGVFSEREQGVLRSVLSKMKQEEKDEILVRLLMTAAPDEDRLKSRQECRSGERGGRFPSLFRR